MDSGILAVKDSKAGSPIVQTEGFVTVHESTLLQIQTPAHPEQIQASTLRSLLFDNIANVLR